MYVSLERERERGRERGKGREGEREGGTEGERGGNRGRSKHVPAAPSSGAATPLLTPPSTTATMSLRRRGLDA